MRVARIFAKQFLFDTGLSFGTAIENMATIYYCSDKSTLAIFLVYNRSSHKLLQHHLLALPLEVLIQYPTIYPTTTITITSTNIDNHNNFYLFQTASTGGPISSYFDIYHSTFVGNGDITIHTLVPATISAEPYRKALIVKHFFR